MKKTSYAFDLAVFKTVLDEIVKHYTDINARHPNDVIFYHAATESLSAVMGFVRRSHNYVLDSDFEAAYEQAFRSVQAIFNPLYRPSTQEAACSSNA